MNPSEFPPNSKASQKPPGKVITPVVTEGAVRRRKSLRRKFTSTFVEGDFRTALAYSLIDVMLPAARDTIVDSIVGGVETFFRGDSRRRASTSGKGPYVSYNKMSQPSSRYGSPQRAMSRRARSRHDFDEIILDSRQEAEDVLEQLYEIVSRYESATVADLYDLVGLPTTHTDNRWGWIDLEGSGVTRMRNGYLLDLPEPEPID